MSLMEIMSKTFEGMKIVGINAFGFIMLFGLMLAGNALWAQKRSKIEILNSNSFKYNKSIDADARRLIGNVKFKQDSTIMTCDSAYFYSEANRFEAFSNVHLYKMGDNTVDIRSEYLKHDGNTKKAYFRRNVILRDTQMVLTTDSLDYDISADIGYYKYGGTIVDSASTLTSKKGYYYNNINTVYFKEQVQINHNNGEYVLYTDTIEYNTKTEVAWFRGPTTIVNDTNNMFANLGWYDTKDNTSLLTEDALYTNPHQSLEADSIFLDRTNGISIGYGNIVATDSLENIVLKGNYLKAVKEPERIFVTDSALLIYIMDNDSVFIHADTLETYYDTSNTYRQMFAYKHVQMFKTNMQARCDSVFLTMKDTILQFFGEPVIWAENNQITAEYIEAYIENEELKRFKLFNNGIVGSLEDSSHFNQVKGVTIIGYFNKNQLHKLEVFQQSETIYFPLDEESQEIAGMNRGTSKDLVIYLKSSKIDRIIYKESPNHKMQPLEKLTDYDMKVKGFVWMDAIRPVKPEDIFIWKIHSPNETKKDKTEKKQNANSNSQKVNPFDKTKKLNDRKK